MPSIHGVHNLFRRLNHYSFKPCYKWNAFNTMGVNQLDDIHNLGF